MDCRYVCSERNGCSYELHIVSSSRTGCRYVPAAGKECRGRCFSLLRANEAGRDGCATLKAGPQAWVVDLQCNQRALGLAGASWTKLQNLT
eukprot:scaffold69631_cov10-Tisochrysis_lutea.AAC.1